MGSVAHLLPRFRKAAEQVQGPLEEREKWTREAIEAYQLERLNALWAGAVADVPYYARLGDALGLPRRFATFEEFSERVPILTKAAIRTHGQELLSRRPGRGRWHRTSGSTGRPLAIFWSGAEYRSALATKYRFYASHGVQLFERTAFLCGGDPPGGGLAGRGRLLEQQVTDRLRNRIRLSPRLMGPAELGAQLQRLERFRPVMLYGFSRAIHLLAREAIRSGFDPQSVRLVVPTSEVATPPVIATIARAFRAPVAMEYGATECPLIAGQDTRGAWRVREDAVFLETIPRTDGRFDLVLTVLGNTAFPLIRYAIEDVVDRPLEKGPVGFACLAPVFGRDDEILVSGSGAPIHPTAVDAVLEIEPAIRRYRVTQAADGSVSAEVEPDGPIATARVRGLEATLTAVLERPVRIEIVDVIALTTAGKHRAIRSDFEAAGFRP
jgi:phenylacetate-CoA ligase